MSDNSTNILNGVKASVEGFIAGTKGEVQNLIARVDHLESKAHAAYLGGGRGSLSLGDVIVRGFTDQRDAFNAHGRLMFEPKENPFLETKAAITTANIVTPDAISQIGAARANYGQVRRVLRTVPMTGASVFRVKETINGFVASPQTESYGKAESTATLSGDTIPARTIATWVQATKQAADDVEGLAEFLNSSLVWAVERELEEQILLGNNVGQNLNGLANVATAFDNTILSAGAGWQRADVLAAAATQIEEAGFTPTHFVLAPRDFYSLSTEKDAEERYLLGSPRSQFARTIWGVPIIVSPAMSAGGFIAFDASQVTLRMRQGMTVDVSESHANTFTENVLTWRCELRCALVVQHSGAVVMGSLTTSPA